MATQMTTDEIKAQGGAYRRENGDTQITLANHVPSGEAYALRYVSVWRDNECIGHTISDVIGPLHHTDIRDGDGNLLAPGDMADIVDALDGADALEDVDWAREQDWQDFLTRDESEWAKPKGAAS